MATDPGFAPAKINLTLHVTGQRADGYHLLDSLVVFADIGDRVTATPATGLSLALSGPEAPGLTGEGDNLVLRAAQFLGVTDARLSLEKHLPVSSGIGGGSADAAATLRVLAQMTRRPLGAATDFVDLGADVPVCLDPRPTRMRGIGEQLTLLAPLPPLWLVLANPRVAVATPAIFRNLTRRDNPPMPDPLPTWRDIDDLIVFLGACRNDLQDAAVSLAPVIGLVLDELAATDACRLTRMSGSGATCFGLYETPALADAGAASLAAAHPDWWVKSARVMD